ncbi:MAG: phage tail tape measure protein [Clostridiales Family XIII bacterium]|nr:phage tail tape measure protein [Clostridia bacterium]MDY3011764.1 phage tail tape measure protein [Clostridiales Family XIII bacterium]
MPAKEPITTKFKVDISDLKRGITEANNTIKKANAEFNAATAGMDDWANSADGVKAKLKQLDSVLNAQRKKLENYKEQFERLQQAEKANAKRVDELRTKYQQAAQQFGKNSKEAQQYKTALNAVEKEQIANAKAADKAEITMLNQVATVGKVEKQIRQYDSTLKQLDQSADQADKSLNDLSKSVQNTSDGFTTMKGTIATALGSLVADKISGFIGEVKSSLLDTEESLDKFQAATGTSAAAMGEFKEQILDLYKNNYGESIDDVAESMARVKQVIGETDPSKLQEMTKYAIDLRDTFGSDFDESIRGINNLMYQYGISAEEAFDLFAKGSQVGLDYTDELGDNVAEYSGNFKQAGYSAEEYFQLLENGTSNGAYNLDKVNDAINEATNKLADGSVEKNLAVYSKGTQDLFKSWQKGGATQKDVIDSIVDDINTCENEQKALTMAATLFGTMGEDSNLDFIKSLTSVGDTFSDVKGTMEDVDQVRWDNTKSQMVSIGRSLMVDVVQPLLNTGVPALNDFGGWFKAHIPEIISLLAGIGTALLVFKIGSMPLDEITGKVGTLKKEIKSLWKTLTKSPMLILASLIAAAGVALVTYAIATNKATSKTREQKKAVDELVKAYKDEKKSREDSLTSAQAESGAAEELTDKITELAKKTNKTAAEKKLLAGYVDQLNSIMPDLALKYDEENDKLSKNTENLYANIEAMRANAEAKAAQELVADALEGRIKAEKKLADVQAEREVIQGKIADVENRLANMTDGEYSSTVGESARKELSDLNDELEVTSETIEEYTGVIKGYDDEINSYEKTAKKALDWSAQVESMQGFITEAKKSGVQVSDSLAKGILEGQYGVVKSVDEVGKLAKFEKAAKKAGVDGVAIPKNLADGIKSGDVSTKAAVERLNDLATFDEAAKKAGMDGTKVSENLRSGIANGSISVSNAVNGIKTGVAQQLDSMTQKFAETGQEIPPAVSNGILSGQYVIPTSVDNMKKLISFNDMVTKAGLEGTKIPPSLAQGISTGTIPVQTAFDQLNNLAKFDEAVKNAGADGKDIVNKLRSSITSEEGSVSKAVAKLNKAMDNETKKQPPKMKKQYKKAASEGASGLSSQKSKFKGASKGLGTAAKTGADTTLKGLPKIGTRRTNELAATILKSKGKVNANSRVIGKGSTDSVKSGSSGASSVGSGIISGILSGIASKAKELFSSLRSLAKNALDAAKSALGIHSPSIAFRNQVGRQIVAGIVVGMRDSEGTLLSTMKSIMGSVLNSAKLVTNGQFSTAGAKAAEQFSTAIQSKLSTLSDKMSYTVETKLARYDTEITKSENELARREKYEEKLKSLKASNKYKKASKKQRKKMLKDLKKQYKDVAGHSKKYYQDIVTDWKNRQEAHKTATDKALSEFNDVMSKFGSQAEQLVSDTINGITETYQSKWDNLVSLQDTMVQKLQGFGDLFTVSGAGVMTVNDIKSQTDQIKAYMERLQSIKGLVSDELFAQIATYDVDQGKAFIDQLLAMSQDELKAYNDAYTEKLNLSEKLTEELYKSDFDKISSGYKDAITQAFAGLPAQLEIIAKQCMQGFASGLTEDTNYLSRAVQDVANEIIKQFKNELQINSPSKVFATLGGFSAEGYGEGFIQQMKDLKSNLVASVPMQSIARAGGVVNHQNSQTVNQTFNQYNSSPKALSRLEIYRQTKNALAFSKGV